MRVLHTADWHLGAKLGPHDRAPDHRAALEGLIEAAREESPDLIVHAGDVWDGFHPSHEALHMGLRALSALGALAPTVVVRGNHDSARLFAALDEVFGQEAGGRVRMVAGPQALAVETARAGTARVLCMPFLTRTAARQEAAQAAEPGDDYSAWTAAVNRRLVDEAATLGSEGPAIYAAHLYVAGCRPGRSERRVTVTDDYATEAGNVPEVAYAAFGHIHDAQTVGRSAAARYAGALIRMSFQEATGTKTTAVVDIQGTSTRVREIPNRTGRALVEWEGPVDALDDLAAGGRLNDAILRATVLSENRIYNLAERLCAASPGVRIHELVNRVENAGERGFTNGGDEEAEAAIEELFGEWREARLGTERENDETACAVFAEAVRNGQAPGTSDFGAGELENEFERLRSAIAAVTSRGSRLAGAARDIGEPD